LKEFVVGYTTLLVYTPFNVVAAQLAAATPLWQDVVSSPNSKLRTLVGFSRQQLTHL